jgi:HlyD family type I secretion membrane fusion protein
MATIIPISTAPEAKEDLARQLSSTSDRISRRLGLIGGAALALTVGIATLVPIESGALAPGHVMVENKRKTVQHLDGGIIRHIHVREGAQVKAGQPLITLDDTNARLNVSVYQAQADALRAEQAALEAQLLGKRDVAFPADLMARINDPDVARLIQSQRAAFAARRDNVFGRRSQFGEQLGQTEQEISGDAAAAAARTEQLHLLHGEITDIEGLLAKGFATKQRLLALKRAAAQTRGERAMLHAEASKLRTRQAEIRIQSLQVERDAASEAANGLRVIQGQLVEVQDKLAAARQILDRTLIRAPVAGTVVGLRPTTVGGVIQPGEALMDVVPNEGRLVVAARVSPRDADDLHVGQPADLRFDASGAKTAPVVGGTLQKFSADALTDPRTGELYFEAEVIVPEADARRLPPELLKPGVPAEVLIKTGRRTALGYFLAPITRARFKALRER